MKRYLLPLASGISLLSASMGAWAQTADQLVGAWSLVSLSEDHAGRIEHPMGDKPRGMIIYDESGTFANLLIHRDRPKTDTAPMTPVGPAIAFWGTWSLEGNALTYHVDAATFPGFEGSEQKGIVTLAGDMLKIQRTVKNPRETFTANLELKRIK